jgi:hypothetical protein
MSTRVAVLVSGHMRTFEDCWSTWENVCEANGFTCEYYVHTYDSIDSSSGKSEDIQEFLNKINPISFAVDNEEEFYKNQVLEASNALSSLPLYKGRSNWAKIQSMMFKKNQLCFNLCKSENREYDLYVRLRPDIFWAEPFIFQEEVGEKELVTVKRGPHNLTDYACDIFGLMKEKTAFHYFNTYETLLDRATNRSMRRYNAEVHLGMQMRENDISITEIDCPGFSLKRTKFFKPKF